MSHLSTLKALLGNHPLFTLTTAGKELRVVRFTATEGLSSLFEVSVELAGPEVDLAGAIDAPMTLEIAGIDTPRYLSGICASFDYVGHTRELQLYEALIVPALWRLQFRRNSRIFQDMTTPDIARKVLKDAGIESDGFRFSLIETYAPRNYCVQYQEDDLTFLCRLLEEDGIFFFFEHAKDAHTLVFADHAGAHPPIPGDPNVWFRPPDGEVSQQEAIHSFRFGERIRPGAVTLRDYNLHKPSEPMEVRKLGKRHTDLEVYTYPGEYQDPGRAGPHQGQTLAKLRLEAHEAHRRVGSATSDSPRLTAGHTLSLVGHPRMELDASYRILHVKHTGQQPQALEQDASGAFHYENSFTVTELDAPFRPAQSTPRPVMRGLQTATVVGPEGEDVYTDEHGRVKVQFHWDRDEPFNETSSCWVRVSQMWAGNGWGAMFIPRIGHEVLIDFIEGDPDRPVITGRVYTGQNVPPYPLPEDKTKSTIKSESSRGGGGFNELRFEDNKGGEQIFLHAQRDLDEVVLNNHTEDVGCDETITIGSNQSTTVGADRTMHVKGNFTETIDGTETRTVTGAVEETFSASETRNISSDQSETIGGSVTRTITGSVTESITGSLSQTITGGVTVTTPSTYDVTAVGGVTMTATGGIKMIAPAGFTVIAPGGTKTIDQDFWKFGGGQGDAFAWALGITGIKLEMIGISMAHTNIKLEHVGMAIEYKTASFSHDGAEVKSVGAALMQGYASLHTFGLLSIL
ncbi:type VI secretion system Vgr family protein [Nannocystis pusilla]|uniref:Type VI secretion system tip protein VgrG n=1 Tax=Nannocystis pusilla TaxID=889268 RepID=A0ABS7TQR0_9BACT|nr:type VI secretion system tip protein VgrG [Nannocystis pusilla]MBZ5710477.1 type VI secretion system tip protein VgrG [Nannocystis pusilla]